MNIKTTETMTAATKNFLMNMAAQMPVRTKSEYEFIKEAINENKAQRSGMMKLAWFYIKKFKLSFKIAINKAWGAVRERIAQTAKAVKMDLSMWTKFS